jgi:hypothetical protein
VAGEIRAILEGADKSGDSLSGPLAILQKLVALQVTWENRWPVGALVDMSSPYVALRAAPTKKAPYGARNKVPLSI